MINRDEIVDDILLWLENVSDEELFKSLEECDDLISVLFK